MTLGLTSVYPVLISDDPVAAARFWRRHFGFRVLFEADWYLHLQSAEDPAVNLAMLARGHETLPERYRDVVAAGVLINIEVADVDAVHARLAAEVEILLPLRSEAFGQRHFIAQGPDGVMIDVIIPIPPSEEFAAGYDPAALPG